jgi:hypothetical protein
MSWAHIPHHSRSDSLIDVAEAARELPGGKDRDVSRQLALAALIYSTAASGRRAARPALADGPRDMSEAPT